MHNRSGRFFFWQGSGYRLLSQIRRSITLDPHLNTYIPKVVNNGRYLFNISGFSWNNNAVFFLSSHQKTLNFLSPQFEKEKKWSNKDFEVERTWTGHHLLKNLWSFHLGYLRVDDCRRKKVDEIFSVTPSDYLYQHCACKRLLCTDTIPSFRAFRVERQWWASYSSFDNTLVSLGLENTALIYFLAILVSAAPQSLCRLGK